MILLSLLCRDRASIHFKNRDMFIIIIKSDFHSLERCGINRFLKALKRADCAAPLCAKPNMEFLHCVGECCHIITLADFNGGAIYFYISARFRKCFRGNYSFISGAIFAS